ncbi:hypothetical protein [Aggregatibacter actinomycetemcomitans]|uniref:hypothetical protein n=1 Tax=Aggregatibacter actinomycetemcomitans TaxID=714 RepID=UPI000518CCF3|nr:hypothetical protein [Aggregatibacter actinomycetemcomitans]KOE66247.1 hypothetical protein SCC393_0305985 [Aggregatibacter actinomycetemcomitans serotype e str. SCC393]KOE66871.1 hypothetical protein A160_0203165 [Aggregatibacter actinomycetemcomitans serotype e str. A160]KOE69688.1 hypothetical protein D18P1_0307135 [Aggregatibacter actinomycetemcomitans serotype f str. D18P1]KYK77243.1 hypothetical protein SA2876_05940 [Aggregatibacter actinomycetemcomitans serotype e str. SA2876]MBN6061
MKKLILLITCPILISCISFESIPKKEVIIHNSCSSSIDYYIYTPNLDKNDKRYIKNKFILPKGESKLLKSHSVLKPTDEEYIDVIFFQNNSELPYTKIRKTKSAPELININVCP